MGNKFNKILNEDTITNRLAYKFSGKTKISNHKMYLKRRNNHRYMTMKLKIDSNSRMRIRTDVMELLGGPVCIFCGYCEDIRALQLDHKYSDGYIDEKRFKNNIDMYRHYREHPEEAKGKLQVLCANCNKIKQYTNKEWN